MRNAAWCGYETQAKVVVDDSGIVVRQGSEIHRAEPEKSARQESRQPKRGSRTVRRTQSAYEAALKVLEDGEDATITPDPDKASRSPSPGPEQESELSKRRRNRRKRKRPIVLVRNH